MSLCVYIRNLNHLKYYLLSTRWLMCAVIDGWHRIPKGFFVLFFFFSFTQWILVAFCTILLHSLEHYFSRFPVLSFFPLLIFVFVFVDACWFTLIFFFSNSVCYVKFIAHLTLIIHELETNHVSGVRHTAHKTTKIFFFLLWRKCLLRTHTTIEIEEK